MTPIRETTRHSYPSVKLIFVRRDVYLCNKEGLLDRSKAEPLPDIAHTRPSMIGKTTKNRDVVNQDACILGSDEVDIVLSLDEMVC